MPLSENALDRIEELTALAISLLSPNKSWGEAAYLDFCEWVDQTAKWFRHYHSRPELMAVWASLPVPSYHISDINIRAISDWEELRLCVVKRLEWLGMNIPDIRNDGIAERPFTFNVISESNIGIIGEISGDHNQVSTIRNDAEED